MKFRTSTQPTPVEEAFARAKRERLKGELLTPGAEVLDEFSDDEQPARIKMTKGIMVDGELYANAHAAWKLVTGCTRPGDGFGFICFHPGIRAVFYRSWKIYCVADVREAWLEQKCNVKPRFSKFRDAPATPPKCIW